MVARKTIFFIDVLNVFPKYLFFRYPITQSLKASQEVTQHHQFNRLVPDKKTTATCEGILLGVCQLSFLETDKANLFTFKSFFFKTAPQVF